MSCIPLQPGNQLTAWHSLQRVTESPQVPLAVQQQLPVPQPLQGGRGANSSAGHSFRAASQPSGAAGNQVSIGGAVEQVGPHVRLLRHSPVIHTDTRSYPFAHSYIQN